MVDLSLNEGEFTAMAAQELRETIGELIREHRKAAGLTQAQLATLAGVGKTVVFDLEQNKPTVRLQTLLRVLKPLNVRLTLDGPMAKVSL